MAELIYECVFRGTVSERVQELWLYIHAEYESQNCKNRLGELRLTMSYHGERAYLCFTGKAAESVQLLFVCCMKFVVN